MWFGNYLVIKTYYQNAKVLLGEKYFRRAQSKTTHAQHFCRHTLLQKGLNHRHANKVSRWRPRQEDEHAPKNRAKAEKSEGGKPKTEDRHQHTLKSDQIIS